jgi:Protein of unknown function (DUF669)
MPYDYSNAPAPRGDFEPIPVGTIATVSLHIKAGNAGEDGLLTRSQDGGCEMLVAEVTIIDGPYKGRKIWERMILVGSTPGHAQAIDISRGTLKAILDATRGLKPDDMSEAARAARTVELRDFDGATFLAKLGIEKGGPVKDKPAEFWPDKNTLAMVITNDKKEWRPIDQPPPFEGNISTSSNSGGAASSLPVERPSWA